MGQVQTTNCTEEIKDPTVVAAFDTWSYSQITSESMRRIVGIPSNHNMEYGHIFTVTPAFRETP